MQGKLSDINVSDLVVEIYCTRKSGILRLTQGEVKKSLYFKEGSIVFAHSNLKTERLGEVLLRLGKITEEEFRSVSSRLAAGMRLGQALQDVGFLSPAEVTAGVGYQIQMIVYSVFNWDHGEYEFVNRERPVFEDIMVDVSTPQIVLDGIRNIANLSVLDRPMAGLENYIVTVNPGTKRLQRSNLDFSEETILACIDGKASVSQLRAMSRLNSFEFGRALYCLSISGMVQFGGTDQLERRIEARLGKRVKEGSLDTQRMPRDTSEPRKMKTYTEAELRRLISDTHAKLTDATDEEVLSILPDAMPEEIQEAYDRMTALFHPPYYSTERYRDVKDPLKEIIDRLNEAHRNLLDRASVQQPLLEEELLPSSALVWEASPEAVPAQGEPAGGAAAEPAAAEKPLTTEELQESLRRQPANTGLMRELGLRLQKEQRAIEGEKILLRALEVQPQNVENHFALADFYQAQGLKFKAFKHLNIILKLDPENQKALDALGIKRRRGGLYDI